MPAVPSSTLAFVPQYYYDLFISYAHGDEAKPVQWVSRFKTRLEAELGQRLGQPPAVWFDLDRLKPGFQLKEKVRYDLERTAVLLRLISPSYNNSGYCALERDWFESARSPLDPLIVDTQSRSIMCVLRPDPEGALASNDIYSVLHNDDGTPYDPESESIGPEVSRLAIALEGLLRRMAAKRQVVYAPYAGAEVQPIHDRLIHDLHASGYRTIPRRNDPFQRTKSIEDLNRAQLAVFLLGSTLVPGQEDRVNVAREIRKEMIVWIDPDSDMEAGQVEFADRLLTDPPGELLRQRSVQDLTQTVRKRLEHGFPATLAARVEALKTEDETQKILLICKYEERGAAEHVRLHVERSGFTVLQPDVTAAGGVAAQRVDSLAKFSQASGVLLFAKSRAPTWFDQQLRRLSQRAAGARLAHAVALLDPPPKPDMVDSAKDKGFKEDNAARLLVVGSGEISAHQLEPFFALLRAGSNS